MVGIEAQAIDNLRNAFSVVGLMEEMDSFYDMLDKRIDYVDLQHQKVPSSDLHQSGSTREKLKCKELFKNETYRENLRSNIPMLAAMERVYNVGVEVNRFQREELNQCDAAEFR